MANKLIANPKMNYQTHLMPQVLMVEAPQLIPDVASVEQSCARSEGAVCLFASPSHYYFWDPAGPPAPVPSSTACMPEVMSLRG